MLQLPGCKLAHWNGVEAWDYPSLSQAGCATALDQIMQGSHYRAELRQTCQPFARSRFIDQFVVRLVDSNADLMVRRENFD